MKDTWGFFDCSESEIQSERNQIQKGMLIMLRRAQFDPGDDDKFLSGRDDKAQLLPFSIYDQKS